MNIDHVRSTIEEKNIEAGSVFFSNGNLYSWNQGHPKCFGKRLIFSCSKKRVVSGNRQNVNPVLVGFDHRIADCIIDERVVEIASCVAVKITEKVHWTLSVKGG